MKTRPHVIPVGGEEPAHIVAGCCWCMPWFNEADGVVIHHAKDLREARERHGHAKPGENWVVVLRAIP